MADLLDLTHKDYRNFVKHCRECNSTLEIKTYIDRKILKYSKENDDILICLMEKVEALEIAGVYEVDNEYPYYLEEISNIKLDAPDEIEPQLKYLYSYIIYLSNLSDSKDGHTKHVSITGNVFKTEPNKSFQSKLTVTQLKELFNFLTLDTNSYLEKKSEKEFYKIFGAVELNSIKPIKWLSKYRKGLNARLLFELIKHLCKHEYLDAEHKNSFYEKIATCFLDSEGQKLDTDNLRSNFSKWKKKTYTEQCLEQTNFHNENFVLLNYLRENKLLDL